MDSVAGAEGVVVRKRFILCTPDKQLREGEGERGGTDTGKWQHGGVQC